jgi:hypothetical protein
VIAKFHPFDPRLHAMRLTEREAEERGITPTALLNEKLAAAIARLAEMNERLREEREAQR